MPKEMNTTYSTKTETIKQWTSWFEEKSEDWFYLTITVVFDRKQIGLNRELCEAEYRTRILPKFQRRIERSTSNWTDAIPLANELFYYEKDETSIHKKIKYSSPHHIHGMLAIPRSRLHRIWSEDTSTLTDTLEQDLASLNLLSDWLIEPLRDGGLSPWLRYITKSGRGL